MRKVITFVLLLLFMGQGQAFALRHRNDSTRYDGYEDCRFKPTQLIAPAVLVTLGSIGVKNAGFGRMNDKVREAMGYSFHGRRKTYADDYIQYLPIASVYGLSLLGAKAKHDYVDRTMVLAVSAATMATAVNVIKYTVKEKRPDSGKRNSFPSGHTATAFMGAEIVREEYGWGYGAAAYGVATFIGLMRLYNERHWTTDVLAGAGIGILSARVGYWLLPWTSRIFKRRKAGEDMAIGFSVFATGSGGAATVALQF